MAKHQRGKRRRTTEHRGPTTGTVQMVDVSGTAHLVTVDEATPG